MKAVEIEETVRIRHRIIVDCDDDDVIQETLNNAGPWPYIDDFVHVFKEAGVFVRLDEHYDEDVDGTECTDIYDIEDDE